MRQDDYVGTLLLALRKTDNQFSGRVQRLEDKSTLIRKILTVSLSLHLIAKYFLSVTSTFILESKGVIRCEFGNSESYNV